MSILLALKQPNTIRDVRRFRSSLNQRMRFPGFPKRISNQATGFSCLFSMHSELKPRRQQQCFWISFIWLFFCLILLICICTCRDEQGQWQRVSKVFLSPCRALRYKIMPAFIAVPPESLRPFISEAFQFWLVPCMHRFPFIL